MTSRQGKAKISKAPINLPVSPSTITAEHRVQKPGWMVRA